MIHLLSYTVYQEPDDIGSDIGSVLDSVCCDGLEMLTSYDVPPEVFSDHTVTVHLPYATDWLSGWEGRPYDVDESAVRYHMYGRDRDEVVDTISLAIDLAGRYNPRHGVMHACNADIPELFSHHYSRSDVQVIDAFCEMMNSVVSTFPGGEPPFKLAFENLWWPGLRLLDVSGYRRLEGNLEFDDWCLCLDTGHMMNCLPGIYTEDDGIDALLKVFDRYPSDMVDRIDALHFHYSASSEYRDSFEERDFVEGEDLRELFNEAYPHVTRIDQHMPFSSMRCNEILDVLCPDIVVHELPGSEKSMMDDFRKQRSLIP
jgi:hypothetical protein